MDLGIALKNTQAKIHRFADDTVANIKNMENTLHPMNWLQIQIRPK